jgi:adenylate cyclase
MIKVPQKYFPALVMVLWAGLFALVWHQEWFRMAHWEFLTRDLRFIARGVVNADERIVLVGIDDNSIFRGSTDEAEIQRNPGFELLDDFPYPRKAWALAIEKLAAAGAKVIVLDLVLEKDSPLGTEAARRADNQALRDVLIKHHDKVVLGGDFRAANTAIALERQPPSFGEPNPELIPEGLDTKELVGFVNYRKDYDGPIRRMNPVGWDIGIGYSDIVSHSIDALAVRKAFPHSPLPPEGESLFIIYAGPGKSYEEIPFYHLFHSRIWQRQLENGNVFKNKIVLIGPTATIFHDAHPTPFGTMSGPEVHTNAIATLLSGRHLRESGSQQDAAIIALSGILLGLSFGWFRSPLGKLLPALIFGVGYLFFAQFSFEQLDLFIPVVPVMLVTVAGTTSVVTIQAVREQLEKRRLSGMLQRYVSKNVAQQLIRSGRSVDSLMEPQERTVTVLFSDVRDFTTMSEASKPGPFVHQLNEYLTEMTKCVFDQDGTLDKFVGDAVMAVFGNPTSRGHDEDAWSAVQSAVAMRESLAKLNERWQKEGKLFYRFGIGLNHGHVMAGDIGSSQKAEIGVIGDTVNVAARIESLTKEQGVDILISDSVYQLVKDRVDVEPRGELKVKGRNKPVGIYSLLGIKTGIGLKRSVIPQDARPQSYEVPT